MSQLASDIIAYCSTFLIWFPFVLGLIASLVICIVFSIKKSILQRKFYKSLDGKSKDLIDEYNHINPFKHTKDY